MAPGAQISELMCLTGHAHVVGGKLVLRGGLHGVAEAGVVEEQVEQHRQDAACRK